MQNIEEKIKSLRNLGNIKPLSQEDLEKAKECMIDLKKNGFSSREISELTGGAWNSSTVRNYVSGVAVTDSSEKARISTLLVGMIEKDISIKDVEDSVSINDALGNVSIMEVVSLLGDSKSSGIRVSEILEMHKKITQLMDLNQLKQVLDYQTKFESSNLSLDHLRKISDVCDSLGGFGKVLQALEEYGSLQVMEEERKKLLAGKNQLEAAIDSLKYQLSGLNEKKAEAQATLELSDRLVEKGLDKQALEELEKAYIKYGSIANVLAMIKQYSSARELEGKIVTLKEEKKVLESQLEGIKREKVTLGSIVNICTKLSQELGYGVQDITAIYEAAAKFGEPNRILQAITEYGELQAIRRDAESWKYQESQCRSQVGLLCKEIQESTAERDHIIMDTKNNARDFEAKTKDYERGLENLENRSAKFKEESRLARMYLGIAKYPLELRRETIEFYSAIFLNLAQLVKQDAKFNKRFMIKDISDENTRPTYDYMIPYLKVELLDLIYWTERAMRETFMQASRGSLT